MTDGEIAEKIWNLFNMRPKAIEERLKLRNPIYLETASYGHMGRKPQVVTKTFTSRYNPNRPFAKWSCLLGKTGLCR